MILFSRQTRTSWCVIVGLMLVMVLFQLLGPAIFRYQADWRQSEQIWRLLTAHWVHVNWVHFGLNAAGLVLCISLTLPNWSLKRWLSYQLLLALGISILFSLFNPHLNWYVGYSGVLYGIFILASVDLLVRDKLTGLLLISAIVIKIAIEQSGDINLTTSDIIGSPVVVDAHLYGVLLAAAMALVNQLYSIVRKR